MKLGNIFESSILCFFHQITIEHLGLHIAMLEETILTSEPMALVLDMAQKLLISYVAVDSKATDHELSFGSGFEYR